MSGSDTPEELEMDQSDGRGGVAWMMKCDSLLTSEDGLERMRKFVRRFKRKGGEGGKPGDIDQLIEDLKACGLDDDEDIEETLRAFLEGGEDADDFTTLQLLLNSKDETDKIKFMNVLNTIKWIPDSEY